MQQEILFGLIPSEKLDVLTREELVVLFKGEQSLRLQMQAEVDRLRALNEELKQKSFAIDERLIVLKSKVFGKSSEKSARPKGAEKPAKPGKKRVLLPSERYPDAALIERDVEFASLPSCSCCSAQMRDLGMTEDSEFLTIIPQQFLVIRQKRHKYGCGKCHGDVKTAPAPPRITDGSSYSDEMAIDVAMGKYCDLIPVERYAAIAKRAGLKDLPPQSLIEATHKVADFTKPAYDKLKDELMQSLVLHADETPHRMLEGSTTKSWYLWGFSTPKTSYFEIHNTRSGAVASTLLADAKCEWLVSDVFSGYGKAVRDVNVLRQQKNYAIIKNVYCNAHARRKFKEASEKYAGEAAWFVELYKKIYRLERIAKARPPGRVSRVRRLMRPIFESMKARAMADVAGYSSKSSMGKAMSYFLKNFDELTAFVKNRDLPIDNNSQERQLRSPVIGRKTWYGTHSERGAETAAVLFSLVESCKLNGVSPRTYFQKLVQDLHQGKPAFTPSEFNDLPP